MDFRPAFTPSPNVKILFNIGAGLDIVSGTWIKGRKGEMILNGGYGTVTGITALGNFFKSAVMTFMGLTAFSRVMAQYADYTSYSTYDTEDNKHEQHQVELTQRIPLFKGRNIIDEGKWVITSKAMHDGTEWFNILTDFLDNKVKNSAKILVNTPWFGRDGKTPLKTMVPTFGDIDSFSEFSSKAEGKMLDENELGDSGRNTYFMKSGAVKTILMIELPTLAAKTNHFTGMTAQLGKEIVINTGGPVPAQPTKKLHYLKGGDKMKSVTDKFTTATTNLFQIYAAAPLINQTTKMPEYPLNGDEGVETDLNILALRVVRSKSGPSGITIELIVSQHEGVLASLTEFHYIKGMERYGINGSLQHYALDLLPDVKLSRTTVRSKIDNDETLCRALNITSEMCQMKYMSNINENLLCTPKELYDGLIAKGYDWSILLKTRGYWLLDNYDDKFPPFLSTMDLLRMNAGDYHPFWLAEDKKTILPKKAYYPD